MGFPGGSDGKEPAPSGGGLSLITESRRSPGGRNDNPLHYSCLEIPMDGGVWRATVHRFKKVETIEGLHFHIQGLRWFNLLILMSLSGPFNLASGGFLAVPPLINNSSAVFNSGHRGWSLIYKKWGTKRPPCLEAP